MIRHLLPIGEWPQPLVLVGRLGHLVGWWKTLRVLRSYVQALMEGFTVSLNRHSFFSWHHLGFRQRKLCGLTIFFFNARLTHCLGSVRVVLIRTDLRMIFQIRRGRIVLVNEVERLVHRCDGDPKKNVDFLFNYIFDHIYIYINNDKKHFRPKLCQFLTHFWSNFLRMQNLKE